MKNTNKRFFCGLGLPKTGTTWLAEYLRDHPSVFLPLMKELQVFNRMYRPDLYDQMNATIKDSLIFTANRLVSNNGKQERLAELTGLVAESLALPYHADPKYTMKAYRRLFRGRVSPEHLIFGEFSTTYCTLPVEGLRMLDSAFPDTRYLMVLRDPVDRFWSHVKHQTRQRDNFDPLTQYMDMFVEPELAEMSNYRAIVEKIRSVIPLNRLHIAFYEELFVYNEESALKAITEFLQIPHRTADFNRVVYAGDALAMPEDFSKEASKRFEDSYRFVGDLFGKLPKGWRCE